MRRKKFNRDKVEMNKAKSQVKIHHGAILFDFIADDPYWVNTKRHTYLSLHPVAHQRLVHTPTRWSMFQAVLCEDGNGERYMKSHSLDCAEPYTFADLIEFGKEQLESLIKNSNEKHRRGCFQLSSPIPRNWDEADIFALFERTGVFQ